MRLLSDWGWGWNHREGFLTHISAHPPGGGGGLGRGTQPGGMERLLDLCATRLWGLCSTAGQASLTSYVLPQAPGCVF